MTHAPHDAGPPAAMRAATAAFKPDSRAAAKAAYRRITRAAAFAAFTGWSLIVFAFITLIIAVFGDPMSYLLAAAMIVLAINEIRGAAQVRRLEPSGATLLGRNELALAAAIFAYGLWSAYTTSRGSPLTPSGDPSVDAMMQRMSNSIRPLVITVYIGVGVLAGALEAFHAWYSFRRKPMIEAFLREQPDWIVESFRMAA